MNKIKNTIIVLALILGLLSPALAYADDTTPTPTTTQHEGRFGGLLKGIRPAIKKEVKDDIEDSITPVEGQSLGQTIKNFVLGNFANITDATVTAVNGSTITISKDGKSYTVDTGSSTKFRRRFWGDSSTFEISVNDTVNVWGTWTDSSKTSVNAILIRDLSIQKRNGVFFGTVTSISGSNSFVLNALGRGNETVTTDSNTKILNKTGGTIGFGDIKTSDKLRVRGVWDRVSNTITEVVEIKDFGQPTATVSPTPTP